VAQVKYVLMFVDTPEFTAEIEAMSPDERGDGRTPTGNRSSSCTTCCCTSNPPP
jgi:hypothetical protein